ncbi:hypothetical protein QFC20_006618 [Naganishia adeliensis]|uniref:Uncharacterized protein n=1 Tax=Naganishia adeliensis TaxID=92952 RepID=A0ACC2V930_9TREE|nr:hypothetical protein QFC20_006618 [Naganishia adeliensis]
MKINQPSASIKLTNVSVVRIKKGGKRFEIACYKNKVGEYRSGIEKDVDEVLQIANVFTNVSKGLVAKSTDLQSAFNTTSIPTIVAEILRKGELQVGEKERNHALGNLWKEVAGLVADKVVDPGTKRPYSVSMVEKAMQEVHFNVRGDKSAKSQDVGQIENTVGIWGEPVQREFEVSDDSRKMGWRWSKALECIKLLLEKSPLPIERARMKVRLTMPNRDGKRLKERVLACAEKVEEDDMTSDEWEVIMLIDPGQFRVLNELLEAETKGRGRMESMGYAAVTTEEKLE